MPPYVKGGVWTNVEDEILRAAISKYGLNQWARVSSLLARKTAKQAKARWVEWLDPSVKKIEWSRDEDEKLLHLAKIMPTQWRSIAPIIGRTATQCIERYQKLLDDAERGPSELDLSGIGESSGPSVGAAGDVRRFRPGDIDPTPESKPARPDEVDMDEDEKEMLAEARARLANTQGKKAKRKDRERMLEESRRLAFLQKRRQLKQAGIVTKINTRPKNKSTAFSMDYNADIPFEHKPAIGFYDTTEEKVDNLKQKADYDRLIATKGVPQSGSKNDDNRKKDANKDKKRDRSDSSELQAANARAEKLRQLNQSDQVSKRRKLLLPEPQVRDDELEQIIKHTRRGDNMKTLDEGGTDIRLDGEYTAVMTAGELSMRTPSIAPGEDNLRKATEDLISLTNQQSSLLGEENTPLNHVGSVRKGEAAAAATGALPTSNVQQTPNAILSQTPRRDFFGVNIIGADATPRETIRRKFQSLPKPKNDFEIVLPEREEEEETIAVDELAEDASERDRRIQAEKEREAEREFKRKSTVLQKGLPRPDAIPDSLPFPTQIDGNEEIYTLILNEAQRLLVSDNNQYPKDATTTTRRTTGPVVEYIGDDLKAEVESMIAEEVAESGSKLGDSDAGDSTSTLALPEIDSSTSIVEALSSTGKRSNKQEEKLSVVLGGYMKRQSLLRGKFKEAQEALISAAIEKEAFGNLSSMETIGGSNRIAVLQEEVNFLADSERSAQDKYRHLTDVYNGLQAFRA